jgi:hypothetical protein
MLKKLILLDGLDDLEIGISGIAYTSDPAVEELGLAFNKNSEKILFSNDVKMRISGVLMKVKDIYRHSFDGDDYEIVFDYETNKRLNLQLQKKLPTLNTKSIFNVEHTETPINAYIINTIFIEGEEEVKYIKEKFNYDVTPGDVWINSQVEDIASYNYLTKTNKIGFSIEGIFQLSNYIETKIKNNKNMEKNTKKLKFKVSKFSVIEGEEVIDSIIVHEDGGIELYDKEGALIEDWSGKLIYVDNEGNLQNIDASVSDDTKEEELSDEAKEDKVKEEELSDERVEKIEKDIQYIIEQISILSDKLNKLSVDDTKTEEIPVDDNLSFRRAIQQMITKK